MEYASLISQMPCPSDELPCRWLHQRIRRYSHITCNLFLARMLTLKDEPEKYTSDCVVPPVLPYLLAACAPSTELSLEVPFTLGKSAPASAYVDQITQSPNPSTQSVLSSVSHRLQMLAWKCTLKPKHAKDDVTCR